ncbi:MAG: tetratricopeptide repeat protein [Alphaproteobacteria bacterium]|nr:tetratricopeptide repeat protein [Alphaproteobacteria bacterium]MCW5742926.1 tetratricopeptide repeat protein [Alphaproteobacteria bacterium]
MRRGPGIAMLLLALGVSPSLAQDRARDWQRCEGVEDASLRESIESCTRLIDAGAESEQGLAVIFYNRGVAHHWLGDDDRAIADLSESIRLNPWFADAWRWRGQAWFGKDEHARAIDDYDRMVALDPANAFAHFLRGTLHTWMRRWEPAIGDFGEAIRLDESFARAWYERAKAWEALGEEERGRLDREAGRRIDPDHWARACLQASRAGRTAEALAMCDEALRLQPHFALAARLRAILHLDAGRLDAAIADFDLALRVEPDKPELRRDRGIAHLRTGQLDAAIADFDAALRQQRYDALTLYGRGLARQRKGDAGGGADDIAEARKLDRRIDTRLAEYGLR